MKKIFLFLIFFLFSFSFTKAENIEDVFGDIDKSYPYYHELQTLYNRGIILPDNNGNFNPKANLTRDEFVGIVSEISCKDCIKPNTDFSLVEKYYGKNIFFDISEDDKYFYCIAEATTSGQVSGYQAGTSCQNGISRAGEKPFCPTNNILLEEALAIIMRSGNILNTFEAENIRNEIKAGKIFENIKNISPKLKNGDVYSFYPDFKKAYEYSFTDYDKNGIEKKLKLLDFSKDINPKQFVTKEDFLRISYIALKNNSCKPKKENNFGSKIEVLEKSCSAEKENCKISDFPFGEKIFDFSGKTSLPNDKNYTYNWRFYEFGTGKEIIKTGKYIDNYNFGKDGKYRVYLNISGKNGDKSEVYTDFVISSKNEENFGENEEIGLKIEVLDKICNSGLSKCKPASFGGNEKIFDFRGKISNPDDKNYTYTWKFYDYSTGKEIIKNGNYLDNYDFLNGGKYKVTLIITDNKGKKIEVHNEINISLGKNESNLDKNSSFTSKIIVDKDSTKVGIPINFTGVSNNPSVKYFWNFGDGKTSEGQNVNHNYSKTGIYKVVLTVRDNNGKESKSSILINIGEKVFGLTSSITVDKISAEKKEFINFTGNSNNPSIKYSWDFGDGNKSSGKNTKHNFEKDGTYTVNLTVSDDSGKISTSTVNIKIGGNSNGSGNKKNKSGLTSFITTSTTETKTGEFIEFEGFTNKGGDVEYFWNFGDGNTDNGKKTSHSFSNNGVYEVILTTKDREGNSSSSTVVIKIEKNDSIFEKDSDGDGVFDKDDRCAKIKGKKENFGCPIFEETCKVDSDCKEGYFCDNGYCKVKNYSLNCAYTGGHIIKGDLECNSCPCDYEIGFNASLRACDIIFPAIISPDGKDIYSKGKYFQIKK